jgi:hypothetical protein
MIEGRSIEAQSKKIGAMICWRGRTARRWAIEIFQIVQSSAYFGFARAFSFFVRELIAADKGN